MKKFLKKALQGIQGNDIEMIQRKTQNFCSSEFFFDSEYR